MPGQDETGPRGLGPQTGRGLGPCGGGIRRGYGRGLGRGRGLARGFGFGQPRSAPIAREEQKRLLEEGLSQIGLEKQEMERKLKELG